MTYMIAVVNPEANCSRTGITKIVGLELYGDDDGAPFLSVEDATEAAEMYFPDNIDWSIVKIGRLGTISGQ